MLPSRDEPAKCQVRHLREHRWQSACVGAVASVSFLVTACICSGTPDTLTGRKIW